VWEVNLVTTSDIISSGLAWNRISEYLDFKIFWGMTPRLPASACHGCGHCLNPRHQIPRSAPATSMSKTWMIDSCRLHYNILDFHPTIKCVPVCAKQYIREISTVDLFSAKWSYICKRESLCYFG
jgi:hypothetical protein